MAAPEWLKAFVAESNRIEGIREVRQAELDAHAAFLALDAPTVEDLERFVDVVQPGAKLRERTGMNVYVGDHVPPPGGPDMRESLGRVLSEVQRHAPAYVAHHLYETLHPFMDGNGRSGRALWLWMMLRSENERDGHMARELGFLHCWYYQSLSENRI